MAACDRDGRVVESHSQQPGRELAVFGRYTPTARVLTIQAQFSEPVDLYVRESDASADPARKDKQLFQRVAGEIRTQVELPPGGPLVLLAVRAGADPVDRRSHLAVRSAVDLSRKGLEGSLTITIPRIFTQYAKLGRPDSSGSPDILGFFTLLGRRGGGSVESEENRVFGRGGSYYDERN